MNLKKQLAAGGAMLAVTAAACLKLAQWAGRQIEKRQRKKCFAALSGRQRKIRTAIPPFLFFISRERKILPRGQQGN